MEGTLQHIADIPAYIFGAESQLCAGSGADGALATPPIAFWFTVVLYGALALYVLWLNFWSFRGGSHNKLFKFLGYHRGSYIEKIEIVTPSFKTYIDLAYMLGVITLWIAAVSYLGLGSQQNHELNMLLLFSLFAVQIYKYIMIELIGHVVGSREVSRSLRTIKKVTYSILALGATPIILCYSLSGNSHGTFLLYVVVAVLVALVTLFFIETFIFFIYKKVSILHSILYLCAVEIFPITLLWGFFYR